MSQTTPPAIAKCCSELLRENLKQIYQSFVKLVTRFGTSRVVASQNRTENEVEVEDEVEVKDEGLVGQCDLGVAWLG